MIPTCCWWRGGRPDDPENLDTLFPQPKLPVGVYHLIRYNKFMIRCGKTLALALGAVAFANGTLALTSDSPGGAYHGIVERNVFDVHAAQPAPPRDSMLDLPPPPTIKLQGITDILGRKQVLFKVQLPVKPPAQPKEESFILTVGERQGEIEVIEINPKAGTVKMKIYGVITNLSLEMNSDKLVNTAPVAPAAAAPGANPMLAPGTIAPPPTLPPGRFPRTLRLPGSANNGQADPSQPGVGNFGGTANGNQAELSHEQQIINMAVQKKIARDSKDPRIRAMDAIIPMPPDLQKEFDSSGGPPQPQ